MPAKDGLSTPLMEGSVYVAKLVIVLLILIMMYKILSHNNVPNERARLPSNMKSSYFYIPTVLKKIRETRYTVCLSLMYINSYFIMARYNKKILNFFFD